jgi:hypothetical protein
VGKSRLNTKKLTMWMRVEWKRVSGTKATHFHRFEIAMNMTTNEHSTQFLSKNGGTAADWRCNDAEIRVHKCGRQRDISTNRYDQVVREVL